MGRVIVAKYGMNKWGQWPNLGPRYRRSGLWGAIALVGNVSFVSGEVLSKDIGFCGGGGKGCDVLTG